ncbi:hypothetical protein [uncultured Pseudoteredinibacter sp.]|uniref:hypothetical protein n=1 Tax=uncultured Pseudoteredinibacter sp. TaxID=1641701 RepID=UPI002631F9ED|nr:hypothetical protein [uncultured Pseudoteredinibacter sp.]
MKIACALVLLLITAVQLDAGHFLDAIAYLGIFLITISFPYSFQELRSTVISLSNPLPAKEIELSQALVGYAGTFLVLVSLIGDISKTI